MTPKDFVRLVTPPFLIHLARRLRKKPVTVLPEWEHIPEGWPYAATHPEVKGWNVKEVLETYKGKWPRFLNMVQGSGPLGVAHESALTTNDDVISHNAVTTLGYVLSLAVGQQRRVSILDWGGGIGHFYLLAKALLPGVQIEYHCKDVGLLSSHGAQLFPSQHFYADESCFSRRYDVVMASGAMQFTEPWRLLLKSMADVTDKFLYIAQLPVVQRSPSFVFVQRPYQYGYNTEYLAWCLNRTEFLIAAKGVGLELMREFVYGHQPVIHGAPEQNRYRGYLFRPASTAS